MLKKLSGYSVLSLISFSLFTILFHTVASAQTTTSFLSQNPAVPGGPTPTVFVINNEPQQTRIAMQETAPTSAPLHIPSPTPTIYFAPTAQPTAVPTATPTIEPTSTPSPTPIKPTIAVVADLETLFAKYSEEFHADKELLKKIARCESGFNATSNNSGMYLGMFQFAAQTWMSNRTAMGVDPNPELRTNPEEAIRTAAYMIARGRQGAWPNCH